MRYQTRNDNSTRSLKEPLFARRRGHGAGGPCYGSDTRPDMERREEMASRIGLKVGVKLTFRVI